MRKAAIGLTFGIASILAAGQAYSAGVEKMVTATGTVTKLQAADRTIFVAIDRGSETRFVWTAETKINGTLSQGAKVTVRYTAQPDGENLARQISVGR
jgi:hypothetical protein